MRYTTNPLTFIPPTLQTVQHIARREGLGELTADELDFVWDLLAKTAGAEVREFDEAEALAEAAAHAFTEAQAFANRYGLQAKLWDIATSFEGDFHLHQHQRYQALIELDLNLLPGYNKPTQAVRLLWLFRSMQRAWVLFILDVRYGIRFVDAVLAAIRQIDALSDAEIKMLGVLAGSKEDAILLGLQLAVSGIQVSEMLRVCRKLTELAELRQRGELRPDPNGEDSTLRDIRDLSELGKVLPSAFVLPRPLLIHRAVSGELNVRDPQTRKDPKQLLFMVVDGSGSMLGNRMLGASQAAGIVMNRLEAVIDGDAEVYLRFFDGELREQEFHADSPESARELMRIIADPAQYLGNFTAFSTTLTDASKRAREIVTERGLRDPEIVFVTDGEAYVPGIEVLDGVRLHTFQVGSKENTDLSSLARQSGGMGVYIAQEGQGKKAA